MTGGKVSRLTINGGGLATAAVGFKNCTNATASALTIHNCASPQGQLLGAGGVGTRLLGNTFRDAAGISCRGAWLGNLTVAEIERNAYVADNVADNNTGTGLVVTSIGGEVTRNTSTDNAGSGIIFSGGNGYAAANVYCHHNVCNGNLFHGIQSDVEYSSPADLSANIRVVNNECVGNVNSGIYALNSTGWEIIENTCNNNNSDGIATGSGIQLDDRTFNAKALRNVCGDTRPTGKTQTRGIGCSGQAASPANITIDGNFCNGNLSDGVFVVTVAGFTVDGVTVTNNTCDGNERAGIFIADADAGSVTGSATGNDCHGNATVDLRITSSGVTHSGNSYDASQF